MHRIVGGAGDVVVVAHDQEHSASILDRAGWSRTRGGRRITAARNRRPFPDARSCFARVVRWGLRRRRSTRTRSVTRSPSRCAGGRRTRGTHFNIDRRTRVEVVDDHTVRLHPPAVDGLALGKLRVTHVLSERFWRDLGFGYSHHGSGGRGRVRKAVPAGPLAPPVACRSHNV